MQHEGTGSMMPADDPSFFRDPTRHKKITEPECGPTLEWQGDWNGDWRAGISRRKPPIYLSASRWRRRHTNNIPPSFPNRHPRFRRALHDLCASSPGGTTSVKGCREFVDGNCPPPEMRSNALPIHHPSTHRHHRAPQTFPVGLICDHGAGSNRHHLEERFSTGYHFTPHDPASCPRIPARDVARWLVVRTALFSLGLGHHGVS